MSEFELMSLKEGTLIKIKAQPYFEDCRLIFKNEDVGKDDKKFGFRGIFTGHKPWGLIPITSFCHEANYYELIK